MEKKFQTKEISFSETSDIRAFHLSAASVYFYDHTDFFWNDIMYQKKWKCWKKQKVFFLR